MSYQLPIIATPVGGITDLVENNVNGILIEPGNKKQLYEAILFLIPCISGAVFFDHGPSLLSGCDTALLVGFLPV